MSEKISPIRRKLNSLSKQKQPEMGKGIRQKDNDSSLINRKKYINDWVFNQKKIIKTKIIMQSKE